MNILLLGSLTALGSAVGWAIATILIKVGMRSKSPIAVNIIRLYLVSIMYAAVLLPTGRFGEILSSKPEYLLAAFVSAQFGFVIGDYFYFNALNWMGVSRTVPITSTYPLWTMLWAVLFLGRGVYPHKVFGALLIVLAIVIVRRAEVKEKVDPRGFPFALLAPLSWSIAIILMDWLTGYFDSFTLAGIRMLSAAIGASVFLPSKFSEIRNITAKEIIVLTGAAFFGLFLGQYLFVYSTKLVGSQVSAPVSAINPIITAALAIILLKEPPNSRIIEGLLLAVIGVLLVSL